MLDYFLAAIMPFPEKVYTVISRREPFQEMVKYTNHESATKVLSPLTLLRCIAMNKLLQE